MSTTTKPLSPEFQFWNPARNPPSPPSGLHSADQIFSHGFLLPLHSLHSHQLQPEPEPDQQPVPSASIFSSSTNPILSASQRWKDLFKKTHSPKDNNDNITTKRTGKNNTPTNSGSAELNINIWPFSRSRSAGNNAARSKPCPTSTRKMSSAPCSRSNSSGESKTRKSSWPSSPGRTGVHVGRSSPVWQVQKSQQRDRVLNLNVRRRLSSCRSDAVSDGGGSGDGGRNGNLFSFRGLFSKRRVLSV